MHFNFDTPFMETFEELNKLNEASNYQASKKFWDAAKAGRMDEVSFHAAFDDELKALGVMDMFDANGVLTNDHPRISKTIDDNPNSYAARALGKLWGLRYSKNGPHQLFKYEIEAQKKAAEEEKARKAEEEKRLDAEKLRKYQDLLLDYLRKADPVVVDTYEEVTGIPVLDSASLEKHHLAINPKTNQYERWYGLFFEGGTSVYKISEEMFQDEPSMLDTIKIGLEKAIASTRIKEAVEELNKIDVIKNRVPGAVVTILGESGTEYEITISAQKVLYMSIDGENVNSIQMIDEPYEVICVKVHQDNSSYSTRRDSDSTVYYSWNSKYATMLGKKIPKKFDRVEGYMGSYTETVKIDKPFGRYYSQADGIDSWAKYYSLQVATD